ncbi:hypothetical protein O6H91_09G041900 [Diphasiastrum complanatum]|nr:hypothetical protein O6H91_09G041900 [Diphasiastrum complanatum]
MTSSHDMGGPNQLWGIKFNYRNGQPVPEFIRDKIYKHTLTITEIRTANLPDVNFSNLGTFNYGNFSVEVFEHVADYLDLLKGIFDFELLRSLLMRPDFRFKFDCMYGVTAAYARPIFVDALGAPESSIANGKPLEDFGGLRPDPNLVYSAQLAKTMNGSNAPDFGAASDGDGDRIMILGKQFYVCPSDSVAIIAANAQTAIPYFRNGLKGVARSVFTSGALDCVAQKLQLPFFEVPSGWKHFGNLMDAGKLSICGEECFEIGADHIREKDSIWAVLAWLSILAHKNHGRRAGEKLVSIPDVTKEHWDAYGRNYFTRHDYEDCETRVANAVLENTRIFMSKCKPGDKFGDFTLKYAEDFKYVDPVDKSVATKQGVRYIFTEGARIMFGLTPGAGSAGPTLRLYAEKYESDKSRLQLDTQPVLRPLMEIALRICQLKEYLRRDKPNVIS